MVTIMPNIQSLLSEFLRNHADVTALVDTRVYTALPIDVVFPAVRITRVGGSPRGSRPYLLDEPLVQFDVWGGPKATALRIAETIRGALVEDLNGQYTQGYVYGGPGVRVGAIRDLPDDTFDPAKPRFMFDATFLTRALYPE